MVKEAEWLHNRQNALLAAVSHATEEFVIALAEENHQSMLKCRGSDRDVTNLGPRRRGIL